MLVFMMAVGVSLTLRTGFFQFRRLPSVLRHTIGTLFEGRGRRDQSGISPFQAVSTALAATLGTGNIAGVATALVAGGPGAIFWMWASALFTMMTKYAEVALAVLYRERDSQGLYRGGPMYYIQKGLQLPWLGVVFAVCCVLASFGIGNLTQVHTMAHGLQQSFHIPAGVTGAVTAVAVCLVIVGGIRRVGSFTQVLVPLMALLYMGAGALVLARNAQGVPATFLLILRSAFSPQAAAGGVSGYGVMRAIRFGLARGVFTNEAGLGSAPMAHASADTKGPVEQGMWGIFEVFADTVVMCGFSGLVILSAGDLWMSGLDGAALTSAAFTQALGPAGGWVVSISMVFFAFSSILGWAWYGECALGWLTGGSRFWLIVYRLLYVGATALGAGAALDLVWNLSDLLNGLMVLPNLLAILCLSGQVVRLTRAWRPK